MARKLQTDESRFAEHLEETAAEEVFLGFLGGPFALEEEVFNTLDHSRWRIMRRIVIEQESKLRSMDDGLEAQCGLFLHNNASFARCRLQSH